jgi:LmbE family N-acetylglucosaminyl deacetylase
MITAHRLHQLWRALPVGTLDDLIGTGSCLILAPHPDDESLGCGGLIAACCAESRWPAVVILTDGSRSHTHSRLFPPTRLATLREEEVKKAVRILGLPPDRLFLLHEPDAEAPRAGPRFDDIVQRLSGYVRALKCSAIVATWDLDPHGDHQSAAAIASKVARTTDIRLLSYPIWGWTLSEDIPADEARIRGWRFDVTAYLDAKRSAIAAHASQYGRLITDDPAGFHLPVKLLQTFDSPWETFLLP